MSVDMVAIMPPAIAVLGALGLAMAAMLVWASKAFYVPTDPLVDALMELMPGANCGACGYPGCADFAEHVVAGDVTPDGCTSCDAETFELIGELLGMDISAAEPMYPITLCQGGTNCKDRYDYIGADTCRAAILLAGTKKACSYGCIGLGDCVRACMFDAIEIADNGLPRIKKYNCKGCGACVIACPQDVLLVTKEHGPVYVVCSSHDKGKYVKEVCEFGCIGCGICKKNCPEGAIKLVKAVAVIDQEKCTQCGTCIDVCPRNAIMKL
jgi:electron transport complex protein RnfB